MTNVRKLGAAATAAMITVLSASAALAQEGGAEASTSGEVGMALPAAGAPAAAAPGNSDHDQMVGRFAIGYLGRAGVPIANGANGAGGQGVVSAPVVGIRYWLDQGMGIDAGLGLSLGGGSTEGSTGGTSVSVDATVPTAFLIHGGLPFALASNGHFTFLVVPELNVGFATATDKAQGAGTYDNDYSGFLLDIGARAGAEIHFGFIGVPQLSLQGSVGLLFGMANTKSTYKAPTEVSTKESRWGLQTALYDSPWNIFASNVAALYYF
ncbi:MAG: hypothetical protein OZ921_08585 [Sorangiineae bacterium]|nr:hypothetical protein [Polyangiaceae bacterium]MEB2322556.1 hypothetical protein [Sorangiineae bacterium]